MAEDYGQPLCEMAAIAVGLLLAPDKLWEPLSSSAKANLASWLDQVNERKLPASNWMFFNILVNVAFKKLGCREFNPQKMNECLNAVNSYKQRPHQTLYYKSPVRFEEFYG